MTAYPSNQSPEYYRLYPRPTYLMIWKEPKSYSGRRLNFRNKTTSTSNTLSRNSALKMKKAISWLVASATKKKVFEKKFGRLVSWRINFITLTLPTQHGLDDRKVKRIFNEFCKWARYNHGLNNYVWKAEIQKRGELHLHIISDCYIHHSNIRFKWNQLCARYGLLNGHTNPNSTDVHAVIDEGVKNLTAYCIDYMQKKGKDENGEDIRLIKGRLWGCSKALSNAGKNYMPLDEHEAENVHKAFVRANWEPRQIERTSTYIYCVSRGKNPYDFIRKDDEIHNIYTKELQLIRSQNFQLTLFERQALMTAT